MSKVEWEKAVAFTVQTMAEMPSETEQVTAAVKTAHSKKALHARDPYNSRHY